jgi:DNA polymerase-3 subunit delta'
MKKFIGHQSVWNRLEKSLRQRDGARTFLFYGPKHSGKYTLAQSFANAFVCGENKMDVFGKGIGINGDVVEFAPKRETKKGITKEKQIDIDEVRNGIRSLTLSSSHYGRKALLVDDAQKMTAQGQNAFLKTLEEPVGETLIILVAHTLETLLPTILSRCEQERFGSVSQRMFQEYWLESGFEEGKDLWKYSLGLPGIAVQMMKDKEVLESRILCGRQGEEIEKMGVGDRLRLGENLSKDIPKAIETLELWAFLFREKGLSGKEDIRKMFLRAEKMYECVKLLKNTQVNARLILENTLLNL